MNIIIFDTETTSLEKPFCYNIGYTIVNTETWETLATKDFIVEQIWHNYALFSSAYYTNKRPIYINRMKARAVKLDKYGYICREMSKDIKYFNVQAGFAYNSEFDEKVFAFNSDWFKCSNPLDTIPVYDIRGYVHHLIAFTKEFQAFCEVNKCFTETGNYSTTAETLFKYISNNTEFEEEHTALADSIIETEILKICITKYNGTFCGDYQPYKSIPRKVERSLTIVQGETKTTFRYTSKVQHGDTIYLH